MALMPVADALAAILAGAEPLPEEMIALDDAWHRVLARDVAARRTQPPQAMSAMDGYAVRAADAADPSARLKVIGEVAAGRPFERKVGRGEAVRIFTGGVIPEGADAVIIQEDTSVDGDGLTITEAAVPGRHIRAAGVDFREIFLSSSIGLRKPDAEAYDHVVKAIGVPASRILFFDDSAANIEGARARGLCAIHVTSTDDVARALTALDI